MNCAGSERTSSYSRIVRTIVAAQFELPHSQTKAIGSGSASDAKLAAMSRTRSFTLRKSASFLAIWSSRAPKASTLSRRPPKVRVARVVAAENDALRFPCKRVKVAPVFSSGSSG